MLIHFLITFLLLFFSITCSDENTANKCEGGSRETTNLWRIKTEPPSFFFGTLHVPSARVWDAISQDAKSAFQSANKTYFELGKVSFKSPV